VLKIISNGLLMIYCIFLHYEGSDDLDDSMIIFTGGELPWFLTSGQTMNRFIRVVHTIAVDFTSLSSSCRYQNISDTYSLNGTLCAQIKWIQLPYRSSAVKASHNPAWSVSRQVVCVHDIQCIPSLLEYSLSWAEMPFTD
jgi:hypothetical protein